MRLKVNLLRFGLGFNLSYYCSRGDYFLNGRRVGLYHCFGDFFNLWNHANFANPSITDVETIGVPNSPFGKIFSTVGTPRLIQFSLRLAF